MDKIQLCSLKTPNGQKVSIALEEMGLDYDAHTINILTGDQFKEDFLKKIYKDRFASYLN